MRKVKLNVEKLRVESFAASEEPSNQGTVVGHGSQVRDGCVYPTANYHSCEPTETYGEFTCHCLYPNTDAQMCCTEERCTGGGMC